MGDFFDSLLGLSAPTADSSSSSSVQSDIRGYYEKKRRSSAAKNMSRDQVYNSASEGESLSSGSERSSGRKRKAPSGPRAPRKKQCLQGSVASLTADEMCKFMFNQYFATDVNWIKIRGRTHVRMANPTEDDEILRFSGMVTDEGVVGINGDGDDDDIGVAAQAAPGALSGLANHGRNNYNDDEDDPNENGMYKSMTTGHPPGLPSLYDASRSIEQRQRGRTSAGRRGDDDQPRTSVLSNDSPSRHFSKAYAFDLMIARKIYNGTHGVITPAQMLLNANKPLSYNAIMHPVHQEELMHQFRMYDEDGVDPGRERCPICSYGACDRQAAMSGMPGTNNSALTNFYVMYYHDRENTNETELNENAAAYWNNYIFRPFAKIGLRNGREIKPSHIHAHFKYCLEVSNPREIIADEMKHTRTTLSTMRGEGQYLETLTCGAPTGRVCSSPLMSERVRTQSMHLVNLACKLSAVNRNERMMAQMEIRAGQADGGNSISFDSGQVNYASALTQLGKQLARSKAMGGGNLM